MKQKILIARIVFPEVVDKLSQHFDVEVYASDDVVSESELIQKLHGKQAIFSTVNEPLTAKVIQANPQLKAICNMAVGYNNIDLSAATQAGILVTNTPDVLTETTADFGWALLMAAARRITESERWLRDGQWKKWRYDSFFGMDLHGATLGILGMGRIGQAIARRSIGFNMNVIYHNRTPLSAEAASKANNARYVSKEELLRSADHLIITLPYSVQLHHTIGAEELALMKPSAVLVNVARGGIVDDKALITALRYGRLAAAGLDVFENEPALDPGFLTLQNVALTPHIASASRRTRLAMANCAADNLIVALSGRCPPNLVNKDAWKGE